MSEFQRREQWSDSERVRVGQALDEIEANALFSSAPRLLALLRYLVEAELRDDQKAFDQRAIAANVLKRGDDFDPAVDSVVRVEIGRLRSRLREFNASNDHDDGVQISLPKGRYKPLIDFDRTPAESAEPAEQEIRFLNTEDNVSIAYAVSGSGPPLVKAANWLSHLEHDFESLIWRHWWQELARRYTLIRYDERGCGLSDWDIEDFSVDAWVGDLVAVADRAGHERFALLGMSQGAAVAARYAQANPGRVSHLVLYGGFALGPMHWDLSPEQKNEFNALLDLIETSWGRKESIYRRVFGSQFIPDGSPEDYESFEALQRFSCSPSNARRFMEAFFDIDVTESLAEVRAPTLVIHCRDDHEVPVEESMRMAKMIPDAKLVVLDGNRHIMSENGPAWRRFLRELDDFLKSG